jgi:hypothetical protein
MGGFYLTAFHPEASCLVIDNETSSHVQILNLTTGKTTAKIRLPGGLGGWGTGHLCAVFLTQSDEVLVLSRKGIERIHWPTGRTRSRGIDHRQRAVALNFGDRVTDVLLDGILGLALSPSQKRLAVAVNEKIQIFRIESDSLSLESQIKVGAFSMTFADEHQLALITNTSGPRRPRLLLYEER